MADNEIAIRVQNLTKYFKLYKNQRDRIKEAFSRRIYHEVFYALRNVNFEVKKGETLGIVGHNGSGKSTLLKLISGIMEPAEGSVEVKGKITSLIELGAGFHPAYTGLQNIYFYGAVMGIPRKEMDAYIDDIIQFADIGTFIDQPLRSYSSGMKSRLGFAASTAIQPDILIVDEVLSVGDAAFRQKSFNRIEKLLNGGCTVLFVSHSADAVIKLCDRAILLNQGEKLYEDLPKYVLKRFDHLQAAAPEKKEKMVKWLRNLKDNSALSNLSELIEEEQPADESRKPEEGFSPALVSKNQSTGMFNADGLSFHFENEKGEKVNQFLHAKQYTFKLKFTPGADISNITARFIISDVYGVEISRYRARIEKVLKSREEAVLSFSFDNLYTPRIYSMNVHISSQNNGTDPAGEKNKQVNTDEDRFFISISEIMFRIVDWPGSGGIQQYVQLPHSFSLD